MRRVVFWLSVIAALTGTPLRHAEAAADFSRMLSGLFQPAQLEEPDGGVGDDSGEALHGGSQANASVDWPLSVDPPPPLPAMLGAPPSPAETASPRERAWWPPGPPNSRHAWLQRFLF